MPAPLRPTSLARAPRLDRGAPPVVLDEMRAHWPTLDLRGASDDIRQPTAWRIREPRHVFVVHLGGRMDELETELDGHGGSSGSATPGEVWSVPAGRHYASYARGGTIRYAELYLPPDAADRLLGTTSGSREIAPLAGHRDDFLHQGVRQLLHARQASDDLSAMLGHALSETLTLHLARTYGRGFTPPPTSPREPLLAAAATRTLREYIHDNLAEPLRLEHLAALAGMSTHHLLIAFRRAFGVTPWQYVIAQRLRCAQRLLTQTRKDLTTIALDAGFSSHSHFTSVFQRRMGCSPREFRARLAGA